MSLKQRLAISAAVGVALMGAAPMTTARADVSKQQIDALQQQILAMQAQLQALQAQVQQSQDTAKQAQAKASAAIEAASKPAPVVAAAAPGPKVIQSAPNRPYQFGLSSADGRNTIELTGRLHADYGNYVTYDRLSTKTSPYELESGANIRRGRLGVTGKFDQDFTYAFIYDFGGSSDTVNPLNGANINGGIENAYLTYTGFKPFDGQLNITLGYVDTPWTMDEAHGSNEITFMERASPQVIVSNILAGDQRSVLGASWNDSRLLVSGYLTGPQSGIDHGSTVTTTTAPTITCTSTKITVPASAKSQTITVPAETCTNSSTTQALGGSASQLGGVARATYQVLSTDAYSGHVGLDVGYLKSPPHSAGQRALTLSDRPELRIDPTSLISTGAITKVKDAYIVGGEAAAVYGPFYAGGEYYRINIERDPGNPDYFFQGGYAEAAYTITGEQRKYSAGTGSYLLPVPAHPFGFSNGEFTGFGAWEFAARFSEVDLNDRWTPSPTTIGIEGGLQRIETVGLNWYLNYNIEMMFNYLHGDIRKDNTSSQQIGEKFDAIATRLKLVW